MSLFRNFSNPRITCQSLLILSITLYFIISTRLIFHPLCFIKQCMHNKMNKTTIWSALSIWNHTWCCLPIQEYIFSPMLPRCHKNIFKSVCDYFLGRKQKKEDLNNSTISDILNLSDNDWHRLVFYCIKNSLLPQFLMENLRILFYFMYMLRVTGVPFSLLIFTENNIKVFSMIFFKCQYEGVLVPTLNKWGTGAVGEYSGYEGTTILKKINY